MYRAIRSALFRMDPERAHSLAKAAGQAAQATVSPLLARRFRVHAPRLHQSLWGAHFDTPFGLAAGFDKNAELVPLFHALGFGFVEVGSVTAQPSDGNPRPRAFRLADDRALINRMGLNNQGADHIGERLSGAAASWRLPVGVNIAKTHDPEILGDAAIDDFRRSFAAVARSAAYVALNVSCPNTREGKTFEDVDAFDRLLTAIFAERRRLARDVPVLVKLSPPPAAPQPISGSVMELVELALGHGVAGFIACNTASDRVGLRAPREELDAIGRGGLSGVPLGERCNRLIRHLYRRLQGQVPIIGVGGVWNFESALAKLESGASLVEMYTGLVFEGPGLASRLASELNEYLGDQGLELAQVIGRRCDRA